jgi:hypothetical protein
MITIPVHTLSRKAILYHHGNGTDRISLDSIRSLLPLLSSPPSVRHQVELLSTITITVPDDSQDKWQGLIRDDAGYNLYAFHMEQILDYMRLSTAHGRNAYTAMMEYYAVLDLDMDELPPERTYKRWQREKIKKSLAKIAHKPYNSVLRNVQKKQGNVAACMETASGIINAHPEAFLTGKGFPSIQMIRKIIIWSMWKHHGWSQQLIAETLALDRTCVTKHINSMEALPALR